jgi:DNA-binding response OmpR family regulator
VPRILIVEDEPALMRGLRDSFAARGFEVLAAADGEAGMNLGLSANPDLILLDVMLPRLNGFEICRAIRERNPEAPILMLTAKGQEEDVIFGLNLGADDYIIKPFRLGELHARVQALLRRSKPKRAEKCRFGKFELDLASRRLYRNGTEVELTAKEFKLLAHFVSRPGRALSRDGILDAVWGYSAIVTQRSIDRCVATLRAKIEADPHRPAFIQTIRDIGYRFEPGS